MKILDYFLKKCSLCGLKNKNYKLEFIEDYDLIYGGEFGTEDYYDEKLFGIYYHSECLNKVKQNPKMFSDKIVTKTLNIFKNIEIKKEKKKKQEEAIKNRQDQLMNLKI